MEWSEVLLVLLMIPLIVLFWTVALTALIVIPKRIYRFYKYNEPIIPDIK